MKNKKSIECELAQKQFFHSCRFKHKVETPKKFKGVKHKDKTFFKEMLDV
jgi:hypothetical protein